MYDEGMSTRRITLTLPEELLDAAERAVAAGRARSVSAYVAAAAGAGEARLNFVEVVRRWRAEAGEPDREQAAEVETWVAGVMRRQQERDRGNAA